MRSIWSITLGVVTLALLALLAPTATASQRGAAFPEEYILPGDAVYPEGIAYQPSTQNFFVSSTTDGTIFRGHLKQEMTEVFLPGGEDGRTTAIGLAVDKRGRLFIAGGATGKAFVYDTASGALLGAFDNDLDATFVNDVAVARDGSAYLTDSVAPYIYKISTQPDGSLSFDVWLDLTGTPIVYQQGFNLNGIVVSANDRYLVVVQSNTGKLFRIEIATRQVYEIDLGGATLTSGDGLVLLGHRLYVVRNSLGEIAVVQLAGAFVSGTVIDTITDPSFAFPTTAARALNRLLVVNSQFDKRSTGDPDLPFTVSSVPLK